MNDEELDELILGRLRQRVAHATNTGDRTYSSADLAAFFNEPRARVKTTSRRSQIRNAFKNRRLLPIAG